MSAPGYALHQEKEKLYVELKHILARQPGPEAAEQLQIYRHTLQEKTKQLKVSGRLCSWWVKGGHTGGHPWRSPCLRMVNQSPKCHTPLSQLP